MTFATKLTVIRLVLVPVFAFLAISYGQSTASGHPAENLRWSALAVFVFAALTDALDGWIARHFHQQSELGAFLDPIADKALTLSAVLILTIWDWGSAGWGLPLAFTLLVVVRDSVILGGIRILWAAKCEVKFRPHWTGKACTVGMFTVLGWVMLRVTEIPPAYPCAVVGLFVLLSMVQYIRQGVILLRRKKSP